MSRSFARGVLAGGIALAAAAQSAVAAETPPQEAQKAFQEMQQKLGVVPTMFKALPVEAVPGAWAELRDLEMSPDTAIAPKVKELIGLGVAAQVPCSYCTYFHTAAAKANGATQRELSEAIAMAALTRKWSTVLNGSQQDLTSFKREWATMLQAVPPTNPPQAGPITDVEGAMRDIQAQLGVIPTMLKNYPKAGLVGAWRELKAVQLNQATALSGKYKELIGLGVAAQIPCAYCVAAHTDSAKKNGATEDEVNEAVAVAGITRHWSTVLNGARVDEATFKRETDQIMQHMKRTAAKPGTPSAGQP